MRGEFTLLFDIPSFSSITTYIYIYIYVLVGLGVLLAGSFHMFDRPFCQEN